MRFEKVVVGNGAFALHCSPYQVPKYRVKHVVNGVNMEYTELQFFTL